MRAFDPSLLLVLAIAFGVSRAEPLVFERGGFAVDLPEGWTARVDADEERLPGAASYTITNSSREGALAGAVLRIERRVGLNPLVRQRWMLGRVPVGYHGAQPVEALRETPFGDAVGFVCARGARREPTGFVFFLRHGEAYYAVQVETAPDDFAGAREALYGLATSVRFEG